MWCLGPLATGNGFSFFLLVYTYHAIYDFLMMGTFWGVAWTVLLFAFLVFTWQSYDTLAIVAHLDEPFGWHTETRI